MTAAPAGRAARRVLVLLGATALWAGCASGLMSDRARVEGRALFSAEPLPTGSVLEVAVEDTARADAPAIRIASVRIADPRPGQPYAVDYSVASVPPQARLSVRARITDGSRLLHITDRFNPVGPGPGVTRVDLDLRTVSRPR